jgi:magnesium chelatase subunit D
MPRPLFPFTAIVGQERMKLALLLNAVYPALGGVLVRGRKGTAKSTAVRALAALLPEITVVRGCPYNCDPNDPEPCDPCAARRAHGEPPDIARRRIPMVELPVGATEDRVIGSLDVERAIRAGERHFEPGLLAQANRGILYIDEVNLLHDHLVDVILDAAAMGRNYVEREGISVTHPARFILVGTMNPEEGELRPQLLDRFALAVDVDGLHDPAERAEAVRRRIAFESDPHGFVAAWAAAERAEQERIARARALLPHVRVPEAMLSLIAHVCAVFEVDGLRADLAMYKAARAIAAFAGRDAVTEDDVRTAAELALPHRRRRQPFEQPGLDPEQLDRALAEHRHPGPPEDDEPPPSGKPARRSAAPAPMAGGPGSTGSGPAPVAGGPAAEPRDAKASARAAPRTRSEQRATSNAERPPAPGLAPPAGPHPVQLQAPRHRRDGRPRAAGRGGPPVRAPRGPAHGRVLPTRPGEPVSLTATIRAAAPHQPARRGVAASPPEGDRRPFLLIEPRDLRRRERRDRARRLVLIALDASGSMGAHERMAAAKGAVLSLLLDAYRRRDRVALIVFRGTDAELVLPPTNSADLAEQRLRALPTGGRTPLATALARCEETIRQTRAGEAVEPLIVLVSDMRPNVGPGGGDPWQAALAAAERLRAAGYESVVIDTEPPRSALGLGPRLAAALGAQYVKLERATAPAIARLIDDRAAG